MTEWQPIETGPKGQLDDDEDEDDLPRVLLYYPNGRIVVGFWYLDQHSKKPRPCWCYDYLKGINDQRANQPTHWMPLPQPPHDKALTRA